MKEADQRIWQEEFAQEVSSQKSSDWNQEFKFHQSPMDHSQQDWKLEFQQTQGSWSKEFLTEKQDWETEFSKVLQEQELKIPQGQVAQTAASIVNVLKDHDKLQNSSFMDFMIKLQNSDLVIENDRVVVPVEPFQEAQGLMGNKLKQGSWEEEFKLNEPSQMGWSREFIQQDKLKGKDESWTKEFTNHEWKDEFLNQNTVNEGFNQEFWDYNGKTHKDWLNEFDQEIQNLKIVEPLDPLMDQMDKSLDLAKNFLDTYAFSPFNPYLNQTPKELSDFLGTSLNQTSSEKILRLEALLQLSSANSNSSLWHQLGLAQQENENDLYAITALKNAVHLNPAQLESWLLLSASYTNENFKTEACSALESWFLNHPEYSKLMFPIIEPASLEERQKLLLNKYLTAVRSSNLIDADIQVI